MPAHRDDLDIPSDLQVTDLALAPAASGTAVPALVQENLTATLLHSRAVRETHVKTMALLDDWIAEGVAARNSLKDVNRRTYIAQRQLLPLLKARSDFGLRLMELDQGALELALALGNDIGSEDEYPADASVEGQKDKIKVKERDRRLIAERLRIATQQVEPTTERLMERLKKKKKGAQGWQEGVLERSSDDDDRDDEEQDAA